MLYYTTKKPNCKPMNIDEYQMSEVLQYTLPGKRGPRSMRVSADSPTEAVNATRAAYPDAEIFGVA